MPRMRPGGEVATLAKHRRRRWTPARVFRRLVSLLLDLILIVGLAAIGGTLLGVRPYVVESGSMEPAIRTGSVCLISARTDYDRVQAGDVVCFESAVGKKVIHRAVAVTPEGIETKGDANEASDGVTTTRENYIGTVLVSVAGLGYAVYWMQTPQGMVICIAVLLILFILAWEPTGRRKRRAVRKPRAQKHSGKQRDKERV